MDNSFSSSDSSGLEVAIIGMAGRFPGARSVEEFWQNLKAGVESISFFSDQELQASGVDAATLSDPDYVKAKGVLEDSEMFDARFFGFNPREAEIMDPQQRIFLECAWEALENAGYDSAKYRNPIGVFAGISLNTYIFNLLANPEVINAVGNFQTMMGNDKDYMPTRVSYKLDLKGPSVTVQTACSTSLVAVHFACQSLLSGECNMALVGGVGATFPTRIGYQYQPESISSPDGHCRAFDAKAKGTVMGNGVGIVVLKRLEEALEDGDTIHAVIKGSAINNDGALKVGFTAPSVEGQAGVIRTAQMIAGVPPDTISYIEAHGTGTPLGDPIEVAALTKAFRASTDRKQFCALGSVKTNIGHLDAAAGVTGLIKTILALRHHQLPPSLHFQAPNPNIDFLNSPFYVNAQLSDWLSTDNRPRRAGVSSFGIGGTNAHVILEEAPPPAPSTASPRPVQVLTLSAKTETALQAMRQNLAQHLSSHAELALADVAATLQMGRRAFAHRFAMVCRSREEAVSALSAGAGTGVASGAASGIAQGVVGDARPAVAMMFPGQGAQYVGMGRELYATEAVFRQEVDACAEMLMPHLGKDIRQVMFGESGAGEPEQQQQSERLKQTEWAQPALFVIEYALARQWMAWGVQPAAMIGHSVGEYVAACLAGVFKLSDALRVVAARGRLMQRAERGAMAAVTLSEAEVERLIEELEQAGKMEAGAVEIGAVNAPRLCVVTGEEGAVAELEREIEKRGEGVRRLHTSHAFHSWMMEGAAREFGKELAGVEFGEPEMRYVENVRGGWARGEEARAAGYWERQMRAGVRFSAGVEEIKKEGVGVWLEVGPGRTLGTLVRQHPQKEGVPRTIVSSLRHADEKISDEEKMLAGLGQLWVAGVDVQWEKLYEGEQRRRVPLPTYPFERQRYWVAPRSLEETLKHQPGELRKNPDIAEWFYVPVWKQSIVTARHQSLNGEGSRTADRSGQYQFCLLFGNDLGISTQVAEQLRQQGNEVVTVKAGEQFQRLSDQQYVINARQRRDYDSLIEEVLKSGQKPQLIAHMWGVTEPENQSLSERQQTSAQAMLEHSQQRGFYSLLFLSQALAEAGVSDEVRLCVMTSNVQAVSGTETLIPEKATVLGPCRVIPQEYANVVCRSVDIEIAGTGMPQTQLIAQLVNELSTPTSEERVIAYRGRHRWVQTFEPLRIENESDGSGLTGEDSPSGAGVIEHKAIQGKLPPRLRERGVYLLTGGTGSIALEIARYLAKTARARLVLVGRKALPERGQWEKWVAEHPAEDDVRRKIERLRELEESGAELLLVQADVSNEAELREAVQRGVERFGEINGVIHTAGVVGENAVSALAETGYAESEQQFQAKVYGLLTLAKVLRESDLDFCLLTSSLASILGGLGFAAYAAANNFMDAFAQQHNQSSPVPWISVNWDGWQFDNENREGGFSATTSALAITGEEGVDAFQRILQTDGLTQVAVSTGDLQARIARWVKLESLQEKDGNKEGAASTLHSRPDLQNEYHAPENETEQIIADIWQTLLGIERVGIHDNFFELGGHSLLATQLISRVRGIFHVEFSLRSFFESPTVKSLAQIVAESAELEEAKKLEALLREVEGLTDEEIESTLSGDTQ